MIFPGFRRWPPTLLGWLAAGVCAFAQNTNLTAELTPLPDATGSVVRVLGALALVLAVFFGGIWAFKNWQRLVRFKGPPAKLTVLEVRGLDNRHDPLCGWLPTATHAHWHFADGHYLAQPPAR